VQRHTLYVFIQVVKFSPQTIDYYFSYKKTKTNLDQLIRKLKNSLRHHGTDCLWITSNKKLSVYKFGVSANSTAYAMRRTRLITHVKVR